MDVFNLLSRAIEPFDVQVVKVEREYVMSVWKSKRHVPIGINPEFMLCLLSGTFYISADAATRHLFTDEERSAIRELYSKYVAKQYVQGLYDEEEKEVDSDTSGEEGQVP